MRKPDPSSKSGRIRELLKAGMSPVQIAKKANCTPALVYNVKARMGGAKKAARKGPGRLLLATAPQVNGLAGILAAVQGAERERAQLRAVLKKLQSVIAAALA